MLTINLPGRMLMFGYGINWGACYTTGLAGTMKTSETLIGHSSVTLHYITAVCHRPPWHTEGVWCIKRTCTRLTHDVIRMTSCSQRLAAASSSRAFHNLNEISKNIFRRQCVLYTVGKHMILSTNWYRSRQTNRIWYLAASMWTKSSQLGRFWNLPVIPG